MDDRPRWNERQTAMTAWYRDLLETPAAAAACFQRDYRQFAGLLSGLSGRLLDVGGGNGVVRHYLSAHVEYVVLEPELAWLDERWNTLVGRFPCLATPPCFIRGIGEYLPFGPASFDAVVAFWSLNHAARPAEVIAEAARVLKPGGALVLVLEDMVPRWRDLAVATLAWSRPRRTARLTVDKVANAVLGRPWPIQSDHVRLNEPEVRAWAKPALALAERRWIDGYLTLMFRRRATSA
jgi:SAM-dependent methyltransferase